MANAEGSYNSLNVVTNPTTANFLELYQNAQTINYTDVETIGGVTTTTGGTLTKTASSDTGSFAASEGSVSWGRFQETDNQTSPTTSALSAWRHWMYGPAVTSTPTSGTFTFSHLGGTQPTDQSVNVGTLTSGGSWTVNFASKTIQSATPVVWTMPGSVTYTVNLASPTAFTSTNSSNNGTYTINGASTATTTVLSESSINRISSAGSLSCSGCTPSSLTISPQFFGATGTGLGVGIATGATVGTNFQTTAQVRVYQR